MECKIFAFASLVSYRYVVILSLYNGKILLSQHKARETWEMQGGHIETGETPEAAARRELFEESGAVGFSLEPLCDYGAGNEKDGSGGAAFLARLTERGPLPPSEMRRTALFEAPPAALTYPDIAPKIFACAGIACSAALCDPWLVQSRKGGAVDAH